MKTLETTTLATFLDMEAEELTKLLTHIREYMELIRMNIESHPDEAENNVLRYRELNRYDSLLLMVRLRLLAVSGEMTTVYFASKS